MLKWQDDGSVDCFGQIICHFRRATCLAKRRKEVEVPNSPHSRNAAWRQTVRKRKLTASSLRLDLRNARASSADCRSNAASANSNARSTSPVARGSALGVTRDSSINLRSRARAARAYLPRLTSLPAVKRAPLRVSALDQNRFQRVIFIEPGHSDR